MSGKEKSVRGGISSEEETTTDDGKRKIERHYDSPFERSKKLIRSPVKKYSAYDDTNLRSEMAGIKKGQEDLKTMFLEMMNEFKEMKGEQRNFLEEIKRNREEIVELRTENKNLKHRLEKVEKTIERTEKLQKKNNIVIKGANFEGDITKVQKFLEEKLKIKNRPEAVQTFKNQDREISVVKMKSWEEKEEIMKNKSKLKGTQFYIDHDLTKTESEIQKKLRNMAQQEKIKGKTVSVGYQKIYINGVCWIWDLDKQELRKKESETKN